MYLAFSLKPLCLYVERYNVKHVKKMSELLESSPLGTILKSCMPDHNLEAHKQLCCLYLNDYIISTYRTGMVEEQQVILVQITCANCDMKICQCTNGGLY